MHGISSSASYFDGQAINDTQAPYVLNVHLHITIVKWSMIRQLGKSQENCGSHHDHSNFIFSFFFALQSFERDGSAC